MGLFFVLSQRVAVRWHHLFTNEITIDGLEGVIADGVVPFIEKFFEGFPVVIAVYQELDGVFRTRFATRLPGHD
jgi:hypothetical protein